MPHQFRICAFAMSEFEEYDFGGGVDDIVLKMGVIDKELAEISRMEEKANSPEREKPMAPYEEEKDGDPNRLFDVSTVSQVSDIDFDDDTGNLASLQGELEEFEKLEFEKLEAQARKEREMRMTPTTGENPEIARLQGHVSVTVVKPNPSSPIGLSMKTVKGITRIVNISESGLLANSDLQVGLRLIEVNDIRIKNAKHARCIIQTSPKKSNLSSRKFGHVTCV